jgi:Na+-translocating ferredoxin:NAD+ oxidoreductase RNF subunit RnfB
MYTIRKGCPGCGACLSTCPVDAIVSGSSLAVEITDACISCGICAPSCPINLIAEIEQVESQSDQEEGGIQNDEAYTGF